jgi:hypothetical protein
VKKNHPQFSSLDRILSENEFKDYKWLPLNEIMEQYKSQDLPIFNEIFVDFILLLVFISA